MQCDPEIDGRPIPDNSKYRVTRDGRVWSKNTPGRGNKNKIPKIWKMLKEQVRKKDKRVQYHIKNNGTVKSFYVSRMVLELFVGPCPEGMEACHNDGDRTNNHVDNLRWDTHINNERDKVLHGTGTVGVQHPGAKLNESQVLEIRILAETDMPRSKIAAMFGIKVETVRKIRRRTCWKHI